MGYLDENGEAHQGAMPYGLLVSRICEAGLASSLAEAEEQEYELAEEVLSYRALERAYRLSEDDHEKFDLDPNAQELVDLLAASQFDGASIEDGLDALEESRANYNRRVAERLQQEAEEAAAREAELVGDTGRTGDHSSGD